MNPTEPTRYRDPVIFDRGRALLVAALVVIAGSGCRYYSFSGATIPSHLATIAIPLVDDRSVSTVPGLDERLTQMLVDRFVGQTRLSLETVESNADVVLDVTIDRYGSQPASVGGQERATRNRVTVNVTVLYTDQTDGKELLRRSFSSFEEYDALDPSQEEEAALAALTKIADDVFTAATSNW